MFLTIAQNVGAILLGLFVGGLANMGLVVLNTAVLYPMPPGLTFEDREGFAAYLQTLPATAFLVVIVAHLAQAGIGGWVAARLGTTRPLWRARTVGVLTLVGGLINLVDLPAPGWMWVEVPLYLVVAELAGRHAAKGRG